MNDYPGAFWDTPFGVVARDVQWILFVLLALAAICYVIMRIRLSLLVKRLDKDGSGTLWTRIRRVVNPPGKRRD